MTPTTLPAFTFEHAGSEHRSSIVRLACGTRLVVFEGASPSAVAIALTLKDPTIKCLYLFEDMHVELVMHGQRGMRVVDGHAVDVDVPSVSHHQTLGGALQYAHAH